jgi:cation:H+ antiporter
MTAGLWAVLFVAGVAVSLSASWQLVVRLERLGERAGFSEASLGLVAALAADAPEITSAATALARGQASVGAGVVIGSNVFNLAALLGLAAVVAGGVAFHRRVVLLGGVPGVWVAVVCLLTVARVLSPAAGLAVTALMLVPYAGLLALRRSRIERLPLPRRWTAWLVSAVHEEETELSEAIRPRPGTRGDGLAAAVALIAVVAASITMEQSATVLGHRYAVADIITGGLVLAVVTSLPNAVSAVYLAGHGRGAAVLSTALNSNAINVAAGLLIPASLVGLGAPGGQDLLAASWYAGLTVLALALAWRGRGLDRLAGALIIAGYLAFTAALLVSVKQQAAGPVTAACLPPASCYGVSMADRRACRRLTLGEGGPTLSCPEADCPVPRPCRGPAWLDVL